MSWQTTVVSIAIFITLYLGWRVIRPLPLSPWVKRVLFFVVAALIIGQRFVWLMRRNGHDGHLLDHIDLAGYTFLGFISFAMLMFLSRDILGLAGKFIALFRPKRKKSIFFKEKINKDRRAFLNMTNGMIVGVALPVTAYAVNEARSLPRVTPVNMVIPHLPKALEGFTIVQLSDTHVGPTLKGPWVSRLVDLVNAQHPDMIVHTGDLVDGRAWWLRPDVAPLADLKARYKFFVTGNHEYYSGVSEWLRETAHLGLTPLVNESVVLNIDGARLLVAGVPDSQAARFIKSHDPKPVEVMQKAAPHDVSLLLAHRPDMIDKADEAGYDMQLSGHTHGGQFWPWTTIVGCFNPYVYGLIRHGNTQLYVTTGAGYWGPPLRLDAPPEISLITLSREAP